MGIAFAYPPDGHAEDVMRPSWMTVTFIAPTVFGMLALACLKPTKKAAPEPAMAQVSEVDAQRPVVPEPPSEPLPERAAPSEIRGPVGRAEALRATFAHMEKGEFAQAFKYLSDDIVWTEVGLPDGEFESAPAIIAFQEKARTGLSSFRIQIKRIIEAGDYQVVEYVWSAQHTGPFADGTAATGKVATLPSAMLLRYQENGLIDRVWLFQDWPNALQQLGLAPDLPNGFRPFEVPTEMEVVLGPSDGPYRETYERFLRGLGPNDSGATMASLTTDDFAWVDLASGQLVADHDGNNAYFAQRSGSFDRVATTFDTVITAAGPLIAAYVTNELIYKGGFMGVAAHDERMTTHTLDIAEFDPETLRLKTLVSYGNSYEIMAALGLPAGAATKPEAWVGRFAIAACDDYVLNMSRCLESVDSATRTSMRGALDRQVLSWLQQHGDDPSPDALKASCQAATEVATRNYKEICPRIVWQ